jgi:hypothetical protein
VTDSSSAEEPEASAEPSTDGLAGGVDDEARRYPSTIGGLFYLLALGVCAAGVVVALGDWRLGMRISAGGLIGAAGLRLVLPDKDAGMLAVRHRLVDVFVLAAMGGIIYFLAVSIPEARA